MKICNTTFLASTLPTCSGYERVGLDKSSFTLGCQTLAHSPLKYFHMERIFTPCPNILLHIHILQKWKVKPEYPRALTPYTPYKERTYIFKIFVNSISLYSPVNIPNNPSKQMIPIIVPQICNTPYTPSLYIWKV